MRKIRIFFVGFWNNIDYDNNLFTNLLKERYEVIIDPINPQYIFCSVLGTPYEYLKYDGIRIFYSGENVSPDFNFMDYAIGYEKNLQFGDRFCVNAQFLSMPMGQDRPREYNVQVKKREYLHKKTNFCNFIYSHDRDDYGRRIIFEALNKYKHVDSLGTYLNNMPDGEFVTMDKKLNVMEKYKFTLAIDSVSMDGFITEKIAHAFQSRTIPIYYGAKDINKIYNENAFIYVDSLENLDKVIDKIIELDNDDVRYLDMLNQPVYAPGFDPIKAIEDYRNFVFHIIEQDYESAFRRGSGPKVDSVGILEVMTRNNLFCSKVLSNKVINKFRFVEECLKKVDHEIKRKYSGYRTARKIKEIN